MSLRKSVVLCLVGIFLLLSGCETAKGTAHGVGTTIDGTVRGAAKDTKNLAGAIMALDGWIKENLW